MTFTNFTPSSAMRPRCSLSAAAQRSASAESSACAESAMCSTCTGVSEVASPMCAARRSRIAGICAFAASSVVESARTPERSGDSSGYVLNWNLKFIDVKSSARTMSVEMTLCAR